MGTTSQKIQYLGETKSLIKDNINLTGANIGSNDTFRSYAVKLRDGLVNVLNNGTIVLYNNFPKVSGTGSNISLTNTLEAPMFMNKFDGDTLQNGTPTPSTPVEIQSVEGIQNITISDGTDSDSYEVNLEGKNLCNVEFEIGTYDGAGNPVSISTRLRSKTTIYLKTGTYTISASNINQAIIFLSNSGTIGTYSRPFSSFTDLPLTFTITNDKYMLIVFSETTATNIQVELGSTATSYVPYRSPIKLYDGDNITGTPDNWNVVYDNGVIDSYNGETITTSYYSTTGGLDTGATIVYKLATPTTEQITDTYLISQLNALYNAKSYNEQTNISVSGNLPMILNVSALKGE